MLYRKRGERAAKALKQRKHILVAMGWIVFFPNSYIEALTTPPHMSECDYGKRIFKDVIKLKWGHQCGPRSVWLVSLLKDEVRAQIHTDGWPCEDTGETGHLQAWDRGLSKNPTLPIPWAWTSSLQNYEKIKFCFLSQWLVKHFHSDYWSNLT